MRLRVDAPPDRDFLTEAPLHVVVLGYPETLSILREASVDLARDGGRALSARETLPSGLVETLLDATAWRGGAPDER